ncbi:AbfB domain-containing protein [Streptomyces sp. NPDC001178]
MGAAVARRVRHYNDKAVISLITSSSSALDKSDATWIVHRGLARCSRPCSTRSSRGEISEPGVSEPVEPVAPP